MAKWDNLLLFKKNSAEDYLKTAQNVAAWLKKYEVKKTVGKSWEIRSGAGSDEGDDLASKEGTADDGVLLPLRAEQHAPGSLLRGGIEVPGQGVLGTDELVDQFLGLVALALADEPAGRFGSTEAHVHGQRRGNGTREQDHAPGAVADELQEIACDIGRHIAGDPHDHQGAQDARTQACRAPFGDDGQADGIVGAQRQAEDETQYEEL